MYGWMYSISDIPLSWTVLTAWVAHRRELSLEAPAAPPIKLLDTCHYILKYSPSSTSSLHPMVALNHSAPRSMSHLSTLEGTEARLWMTTRRPDGRQSHPNQSARAPDATAMRRSLPSLSMATTSLQPSIRCSPAAVHCML